MPKINIEDTDEYPLCPHCEHVLETILRTTKGVIFATVVFICPHCKKVLSIGFDRYLG